MLLDWPQSDSAFRIDLTFFSFRKDSEWWRRSLTSSGSTTLDDVHAMGGWSSSLLNRNGWKFDKFQEIIGFLNGK